MACTLLSSSVIKSVQGEPLKQSKGSQAQNESMIISQCFYSLPTFTNSISLTLNLPLSGNASRTGPRYPLEKWFHADTSDNQDRTRILTLRSRRTKEPKRIRSACPVSGLGDEAFWVRRFVGTLYVLKGDTVLRISIGGKQDDAARFRKAQPRQVRPRKPPLNSWFPSGPFAPWTTKLKHPRYLLDELLSLAAYWSVLNQTTARN